MIKTIIILCSFLFLIPTAFAQSARPVCVHPEQEMNLDLLREIAFEKCQGIYHRPVIIPIPALDPPRSGGPEAEGMVYQEELAVRTTNFLDQQDFYFSPRPRAAVNNLPMDIFVSQDGSSIYQRKTWYDANPDFSSPLIKPAIDAHNLPDDGKVLTEVIIGHRSPQGDYPQLFDLRSSAYIRFAGYPPQIMGASLRLGAHRIFSLGGGSEDFPIIRSMYLKIINQHMAQALVLVENDLFCGALSMNMQEGEDASIIVDGHWYTRTDFLWQADPHTALVAYSSMLWKNETHTPERTSDEAHDSDTVRVRYPHGVRQKHVLQVPENGVKVTEFPQSNEWLLSNEDRDPAHYADFAPALGSTNYPYRASYKVKVIQSNVKTSVSLYESKPDGEYGDNIVAATTLRQDIKKATSPEDSIHFKYKTTSFLIEP